MSLVWDFGLPVILSLPLGWWMSQVPDVPAEQSGRGLDSAPAWLCRAFGRRRPAPMNWRQYSIETLALLLHPLIICVPAAMFAATAWGRSAVGNPGAHGFSEILYEFASSAATNASGFEALSHGNPPWNIATGIVMLMGRYPALILPLAIAGALAAKPRLPFTPGTLRTNDLTFAGLLLGTMLLVGALAFLPAVALGPIADSLTKW
jgi:K+-transporting ATPase ATPase A chain